ncbi:chaplin [Streptomyces niveiscabiei]|uniref:chaplin n=1 Tax=Streptomyces niveiscabiei TaxID=164115 RepID=UPI0029A4AA87|nr:chaplin [Streptomyces niveiscabiei]MDX3382013.1 chaplin [Streptomyces niveiscabiei]
MRRVTRTGVIAVVAASGAMAVTMPAHADSAADGSTADSPGAVSGNTVQLPVHIPVNLCGNTVDVVGLLNPAMGNKCVNSSSGPASPGSVSSGSASSGAANGGGAHTDGRTHGSPGVLSGNGIQLPVHLPVNISGNSVNVVGALNPAFGNEAVNTSHEDPPARPVDPAPQPHRPAAPVPRTQTPTPGMNVTLASTGSDGQGALLGGSAALLLGGAALYRRFRPGAVR